MDWTDLFQVKACDASTSVTRSWCNGTILQALVGSKDYLVRRQHGHMARLDSRDGKKGNNIA